jgi:hypothetical protein
MNSARKLWKIRSDVKLRLPARSDRATTSALYAQAPAHYRNRFDVALLFDQNTRVICRSQLKKHTASAAAAIEFHSVSELFVARNLNHESILAWRIFQLREGILMR